MTQEQKEIYKEWKSLVNMTQSELKKFYDSEEGKEAGLSASKAKSLGIDSGRESARWIMKMKETPVGKWTPTMWKWAKKQINFIKRMSGVKGDLMKNGKPTRKYLALKIWGYDPLKNPNKLKRGGNVDDLGEWYRTGLEKLRQTDDYKKRQAIGHFIHTYKDIIKTDYFMLVPTTVEHAKEYGIESKKPLFLKRLFIPKEDRLKGNGKKALLEIDNIASNGGYDVVFGYIEQKAEFTKDDRFNAQNDVELIKYFLFDNGYAIDSMTNDFHKVIKNKMEKGGLIEQDFYHVSNKEIKEVKPYLHIGSKSSAEKRSEDYNYGNDAIYYKVKFVKQPKAKVVSDRLANLYASYNSGIDVSKEATKEEMHLIKSIKRLGFNALKYKNEIEGGYSYLIINPELIKIEKIMAKGGLAKIERLQNKDEIRAYAEEVLKDFNPSFAGYSDTNGQSMYFNVFDKDGNPIKVRFSDHSVTNKDRVFDEIHFSIDNVNSDYGKFMAEQRKLKIRERLGDESVVFEKIDYLMPSGRIVKAHGYTEKKMAKGGEVKSNASGVREDEYHEISDSKNKNGVKTIKKEDTETTVFTDNDKVVSVSIESTQNQELKDAISGLEMMLQVSSGSDRQELEDAISGLKLMLNA